MTVGMGGMGSDALRNAAAAATEQIGQGPGGGGVPGPAENDVDAFQNALNGPQSVAPPPQGPAAVEGTGDRILEGLRNVSETVGKGRSDAVGIMLKENPTQADLLRANFAMMQSSATISAVSKTTEKITQGIKTLQQG